MEITVCTLALNEENKIKKCLLSANKLTNKIIVGIDNNTTDQTEIIARKHCSEIYLVEHKNNFHFNKNFLIKKAKTEWILWIDSDEYLSDRLVSEIRQVVSQNKDNGYLIPRKNIIFNKWIKHSGWYPDYQMRLFKRGQGLYPCKRIHENQVVKGSIGKLKNNIIHNNYESVEQFIFKLNKYTSLDVNYLEKEIGKIKIVDLITRPANEFVKRLVAEKGYRDGIHGLVLSVLQSFYEFVVIAKIWEKQGFSEQKVSLVQIEKTTKQVVCDWRWWRWENKIEKNKGLVKLFYRIRRKFGI